MRVDVDVTRPEFRGSNVIYIRPAAQAQEVTELQLATIRARHPGLKAHSAYPWSVHEFETIASTYAGTDCAEAEQFFKDFMVESYFRGPQPGCPTVVYWSQPRFYGWCVAHLRALPAGILVYRWQPRRHAPVAPA